MENIREAAVAGRFYTGNPGQLRVEVETMLQEAENKITVSPQALIVPHAGYVFSGKTAARTFATAADRQYQRAIVLAPSHQVPFAGLAACEYDSYQTPLGEISIDHEIMKQLTDSGSANIRELTQAHAFEHALEVELPFLQVLFPGLPIVPFICGQVDEAITADLAASLRPYLKPENLWVISSDFTHYGQPFRYVPFAEDIPGKLRELDLGAVAKITDLDSRGFADYVDRTGATICGSNPIRVLLKTIELGMAAGDKIQAELVDYITSGKISGDYSHCVSYAGVCFYR